MLVKPSFIVVFEDNIIAFSLVDVVVIVSILSVMKIPLYAAITALFAPNIPIIFVPDVK